MNKGLMKSLMGFWAVMLIALGVSHTYTNENRVQKTATEYTAFWNPGGNNGASIGLFGAYDNFKLGIRLFLGYLPVILLGILAYFLGVLVVYTISYAVFSVARNVSNRFGYELRHFSSPYLCTLTSVGSYFFILLFAMKNNISFSIVSTLFLCVIASTKSVATDNLLDSKVKNNKPKVFFNLFFRSDGKSNGRKHKHEELLSECFEVIHREKKNVLLQKTLTQLERTQPQEYTAFKMCLTATQQDVAEDLNISMVTLKNRRETIINIMSNMMQAV